jgi:ABC-type lipoprotein release transport system permease subunit
VAIGASLVIILIVLSSLVICVKKTIQFNSKQIGILKAMGAGPKDISVSYLSFSIVIILLAIPLG